MIDHLVADRLNRISAVVDDIASRPDLGPYEVGVLQELLEEAESISGAREPRGRRTPARRFHYYPGRAVDILPRDPFDYVRGLTGRVDVAALIWPASNLLPPGQP